MVISGFEEKCLNCSVPMSGTIQVQADRSYTAGDFDVNHNVDQQSSGTDRALRAVSVTGTCRSCGAPFSYKMFSVMQLRLKDKAAQQS